MRSDRKPVDLYLPPEVFDDLAVRIAELSPDPFEGRITPEQVRQALEAYGNIRPGHGRNPFQP